MTLNSADILDAVQALNAIADAQADVNQISPTLIAIVTSVIAFIVCEILRNILLDPFIRYRKLKEKAAFCLSYYEPFCTHPLEITNENESSDGAKKQLQARTDLRECAAQLMGFAEVLPWLHICVPSKSNLYDTANDLFALADKTIYSVWDGLPDGKESKIDKNVIEKVDAIQQKLKIKGRSKQ